MSRDAKISSDPNPVILERTKKRKNLEAEIRERLVQISRIQLSVIQSQQLTVRLAISQLATAGAADTWGRWPRASPVKRHCSWPNINSNRDRRCPSGQIGVRERDGWSALLCRTGQWPARCRDGNQSHIPVGVFALRAEWHLDYNGLGQSLVCNGERWGARFQLNCERGKIALGEGDSLIGGRVAGLFVDQGLVDIEVYVTDKATALFPPYATGIRRRGPRPRKAGHVALERE